MKFGIREGEAEPWYRISTKKIIENGGRTLLLKRYNGSLTALLMSVYPNLNWTPWKFRRTKKDYWASVENQRAFLEDLSRRLGFPSGSPEPWYNMTIRTLQDRGGGGLVERYNGSLQNLLLTVYPEYNWDISRFPRSLKHSYDTLNGQREFLKDLAGKLGFGENLSGWYEFGQKEIIAHGGGSLLEKYNKSHYELLTTVFPDHNWEPWRFQRLPKRALQDPQVIERVIRYIEETLSFSKGEDWNRLSKADISSLKVKLFFSRNSPLCLIVKDKYPDCSAWDSFEALFAKS